MRKKKKMSVQYFICSKLGQTDSDEKSGVHNQAVTEVRETNVPELMHVTSADIIKLQLGRPVSALYEGNMNCPIQIHFPDYTFKTTMKLNHPTGDMMLNSWELGLGSLNLTSIFTDEIAKDPAAPQYIKTFAAQFVTGSWDLSTSPGGKITYQHFGSPPDDHVPFKISFGYSGPLTGSWDAPLDYSHIYHGSAAPFFLLMGWMYLTDQAGDRLPRFTWHITDSTASIAGNATSG